ncbi:PREDICTED: uncharacterized protein LOC109242937 [Nicotiana attenuata]|nr:PREDICTED: uncharacterized protein LOC109242937 [Nicotiana attenuata]
MDSCDTIALSWINATLSSVVLDTLLNYACETSKQAWETLASLYLDQVSSYAIHLKSKFQNFKKGPLSMEDYLQQLHSIACSLRAIGKPLTGDDLVTQALQGLPSSYRTFVSGLNATGSLPSFIALRPLLLTEEAHINANATEESNAQTALLASTQAKTTSNSSSSFNGNQPTKGYFHGRGRGKNNKGQYGRGRGYHNSSWSGFQHQSRPPSPTTSILGRPPFVPTKQCQICFHYNHTALECRNRFNHSFVANNIPKPFAAMNLEEVQPTVWYPDSGASAHMTNNPSTLTSHTPYSGPSQVMVGDDTLLSIKSTGSSILPTTSMPLLLKKVLYVFALFIEHDMKSWKFNHLQLNYFRLYAQSLQLFSPLYCCMNNCTVEGIYIIPLNFYVLASFTVKIKCEKTEIS